MIEPTDKFESELAALRPAHPPPELVDRIARQLSAAPTHSWSDRILLTAMTAGSIAAFCIVMLLLDQTPRSASLSISPPNTASLITVGNLSRAYARADTDWSDILK